MTRQPPTKSTPAGHLAESDLLSYGCSQESVDELFACCTAGQAAALGLLAQAHVHQLNAAPFLMRLSAELPVKQSISLKRVAGQLDQGAGLIEAVEHDPRILPPSVLLAIKIASDSGKLDSLCKSIANRSTYTPEELTSGQPSRIGKLAWLSWTRFFLLSVMTFVLLYIMPQFVQMFEEFEMELPAVTIFLMTTAIIVCRWWFIP